MLKKGAIQSTGRRKKSVARLIMFPGKGTIMVNQKPINEYFGVETLQVIATQSLKAVNAEDKFDITIKVEGGGLSGQAGAIRHAIARALEKQDEENRPTLKALGYLTRDSRMKERKKYGLKKARKAPQFSKR